MKINIRKSQDDDDFQKISAMTQYAFHSSPGDTPRRDRFRKYFKGDHEFLLEYQGKVVATAASIPMTQNIRGRVLDMAGVAGVFTYPEDRRKGYVKQLMIAMFADMVDKQQAVSTLYPFKESFYGKFGYITFPQTIVAQIPSHHLSTMISGLDLDVEYKRYQVKEDIDAVLELFATYQPQIHGMSRFQDNIMKHFQERDSWVVEVQDQGETIGWTIYSMKGFEQPAVVSNWFYLNPKGKYGLLRYFALHGDQISQLKLPLTHGQLLELDWYNLVPEYQSRSWVPSAMGRITDIQQLNGITVGSGSVHLVVRDSYIDHNNGCWKFETDENQKLAVSSCDTKSGSEITIQGLSALVYGGYDPADFTIRNWADWKSDDLQQVNDLFPYAFPRIVQQF